ncbi:MAG: ABC transporter permease [Verrucomicrobiia bacterium]
MKTRLKKGSKTLAPLLRYWNIIWFKTYANLKGEIEKTYLGCLWWIVEPLLYTAAFYTIFTHILHIRTEDFVVFLLIGMVAYGFFSNGINNCASAIPNHAGILQQVYLPKFVLVFIAIANITWKYLFSLLALIPLLWILGHPPNLTYLALPVVFLLQLTSVICLSLPLAALVPYFLDARTVISTVMTFGLWFSGVFYTVDKVPEHLRWLFYLNPASVIIEAYRDILIRGLWPSPLHFPGLLIVSAVFALVGIFFLARIDRQVTKRNF